MACYDAAPYDCTYDSNAGAGKEYTSLATWETDSEADISGYSARVVLECFDSQEHNDSVIMNDADNNATASIYRVIRSASGCSTPFAGKANTGANFPVTGANYAFNLSEPYCRVEQIVVSNSRNVGGLVLAIALFYDNTKVINVVVEDVTNIGAGSAYGIYLSENNNLAYGCIAYSCDEDGIYITVGGGETAGAVCCTSVNNGAVGISSNNSFGTAIAFSCYVMDNTTSAFNEANWDSPSDWNGADDATADLGIPTGSYDNSLDLDASLDVDYLATASLQTRDGGDELGDGNCGLSPVDNLSGSWNPDSFFTGPDALYGKDIAGNTRPVGTDGAWDVGASEFVAAGGLSIPIAYHHYKQLMENN